VAVRLRLCSCRARSTADARSKPPLRVNDDRPISHSFEDLAVDARRHRAGRRGSTAATVAAETATWLARVTDKGSALARWTRLPAGETCVCCRVSVSAGPGDVRAVLWRKVFPGTSATWSSPAPPTADARSPAAARACRSLEDHRVPASRRPGRAPTRAVALRVWYTEGTADRPDVLLAVAARRPALRPARRVHTATGSVPDTRAWPWTPAAGASWSGRIRPRSAAGSCYALSATAGGASARPGPVPGHQGLDAGRRRGARRVRRGLARGAVSLDQDDRCAM
jgi:hypothetical protein